MRKREKLCRLCHKVKPKIEFPETDRGTGSNEYCLLCKEKYKNHILIMNHGNFAIDAITQEIADKLILLGILELKKKRYLVSNEEDYLTNIKGKYDNLQIDNDLVLAIGKYNEKRKAISRNKAAQLVSEGAAIWEDENTIRHLFSGPELQNFVVERDNGICRFCGKKGDKITFLISRSENGLLSPKNSICCCKTCKENEGENFFFYKWLNSPILKYEERHKYKDVFTMIEQKNQTSFYITKETAMTLIEEEMAELIEKNSIKIIHDHREFREFILKRDNYTCYYCSKYGDTIDHINPKANGGMTTPKNCICACAKCNEKKGHLEPKLFLEKIKTKRKS